MIESGQIRTMRCFYDKSAQEFHTVVHMGKNVAGYPGVRCRHMTPWNLHGMTPCGMTPWNLHGMTPWLDTLG